MSELIAVIKSGEFDVNNHECEFEAQYKDYTVSGSIDADVHIDTEAEENVGLSASYRLDSVDFWYLKVVDDACDKLSLSKQEMQSVKQDIENFFDKLVQEF